MFAKPLLIRQTWKEMPGLIMAVFMENCHAACSPKRPGARHDVAIQAWLIPHCVYPKHNRDPLSYLMVGGSEKPSTRLWRGVVTANQAWKQYVRIRHPFSTGISFILADDTYKNAISDRWNTRFDRFMPTTSKSSGRCFTKDYPPLVIINLRAKSCSGRSSRIMPMGGAARATPGLWRTTKKTDQYSAPFGYGSRSINLMHRRNSPLQ